MRNKIQKMHIMLTFVKEMKKFMVLYGCIFLETETLIK